MHGAWRVFVQGSEQTQVHSPMILIKNPLWSSPVELTIENLLPGTKIQPPPCNSENHFAPHDLGLIWQPRYPLRYRCDGLSAGA